MSINFSAQTAAVALIKLGIANNIKDLSNMILPTIAAFLIALTVSFAAFAYTSKRPLAEEMRMTE